MRKIIAIPLFVVYLIAISGMMIQLHYCGSKLSAWEFNKEKASCCCEPEVVTKPSLANIAKHELKAMDCCKDKTLTLKINTDQNISGYVQLQLAAVQLATLHQTHILTVLNFNTGPELQAYKANAPPGRWQDIPLYKLHQRFTYYG